MSMFSTDFPRFLFRPVVVLFTIGILALSAQGAAEILVTRDGERIETRGPWAVKGKQVVFTAANGTLQALRLDDVDLEASEAANRPSETASETASEPAAPSDAPRPAPVLTITDDDIPRRSAGGAADSSSDALIARLRSAHQTQDIAAALDLFYRDQMSPTVTQAVRSVFDQVLASELREVEYQARRAGQAAAQVDGLPVVGQLSIRYATVEEDGQTRTGSTVFPVAERLATYVLVAPTASLEASTPAPAALPSRTREDAAEPDGP